MWLMTRYGFFSVVRDRKTTKMMVRARTERHLDRLVEAFPEILGDAQRLHHSHTDYPVRLMLSELQWLDLSARLAEAATEYHNFKDEVMEFSGDDIYHHFLEHVWALGIDELQHEQPSRC